MSQENTPTEVNERRRDVNTRKVIEVLEEKLGERMEKAISDKMRGKVDWGALAGMLIAFLGLTTVFVTALLAPTKAESAAAMVKAERVGAVLDSRLEKVVSDVQDLKVTAAKQQAVYDVIVKQRPRAEAKAEAERTIQLER
jgi:hypothetical protein